MRSAATRTHSRCGSAPAAKARHPTIPHIYISPLSSGYLASLPIKSRTVPSERGGQSGKRNTRASGFRPVIFGSYLLGLAAQSRETSPMVETGDGLDKG